MTTTMHPKAEELLDEVAFAGIADPFSHYNAARELGTGVHWVERLKSWVVLRYDDVSNIARDPDNFSSDMFWDFSPSWHDPSVEGHNRFVDIISRTLFFHDPPFHSIIRPIVRQGFLPGVVGRWREYVQFEVDALLDKFEPGQSIDFIEQFAGEVPVAVIARMLGVPVESRREFREWSFAVSSTFDPLVVGERRNACIADGLKLINLFEELIEERRREPSDGLVNLILDAAAKSPTELLPADLLAQLVILLVAGNETTSNFIANGVSLLLDRPEDRRAAAEDRAILKSTLEEVLRFDPPLQLTTRKARRDVEVGGQKILAGQMVQIALVAANRDPRRFQDPDRFDPRRQPNPHLTFNQGIHSCVGAPLARLEAEVTLRTLFARFPELARSEEPSVRRVTNLFSRGWEKLPVRF